LTQTAAQQDAGTERQEAVEMQNGIQALAQTCVGATAAQRTSGSPDTRPAPQGHASSGGVLRPGGRGHPLYWQSRWGTPTPCEPASSPTHESVAVWEGH